MKKLRIISAAAFCAAAVVALSSCEYLPTNPPNDDSHKHKVLHWEVVSKADCESEGMRYGTCIECMNEVRDEQKPLGHEYRGDVCARCGSDKSESADKAEFLFVRHGSKKGYVVTGILRGESAHMEIPSEYEGLPVIAIGERAFEGNTTLRSIVIPDGVTEIREHAFDSCVNLESVVIPDSVTVIQSAAFCACYDLREVKMSKNLTSIGNHAFSECHSLRKMTLPDSVMTISSYCFANCIMLENVTANGCAYIGDYAFMQCERLYSFDFPKGLKQIGEGAFSYSSLGTVNLPKTLDSIEKDAFKGTYLKAVRIPELRYDRLGAFTDCEMLETVMLCTDNVNCELLGSVNVKTIIFEEGVTQIEVSAVEVYESLETVYLPRSLEYLEERFSGATKLKKIVYAGTLEEWLELRRNLYGGLLPKGCVLECSDITLTPEELKKYETLQ
jgi:hypothetical protein